MPSCARGLRSLVRPEILSLALAASTPAAGAPVLLTQAQFDAQIAGFAVVLENFEGFAVGDYLSPLGITNGSFTSPTPRVEDSPALCGSMTRCLLNSALDRRRSNVRRIAGRRAAVGCGPLPG